jgi:hypothetical protein
LDAVLDGAVAAFFLNSVFISKNADRGGSSGARLWDWNDSL